MTRQFILAAAIVVGVAPLCSAHAERAYGDWRTDGPCNFLPVPKTEHLLEVGTNRPVEHELWFDPVIDFRVHLETGTPHIELWKGDEDFLHKMVQLHPGTLTIAIDGHAFKALYPKWATYGGIASDELPVEIFSAMHDGRTVRIEYQERDAEQPLVREQSLKGFGAAVDACRATPPPLPVEEPTAPLPKEPPDLVLQCKWFLDLTGVNTHTFRVWNSGVVALDERVHPATVGYSEIVITFEKGILSDSHIPWENIGVINRADGLLRFETKWFTEEGKAAPPPQGHDLGFPGPAAQCELANRRF